jgi:hypothetical protein
MGTSGEKWGLEGAPSAHVTRGKDVYRGIYSQSR